MSLALLSFCVLSPCSLSSFFFFNDPATTEIYTLSLHDALPICCRGPGAARASRAGAGCLAGAIQSTARRGCRSEEHTSELQSHSDLVCRLLLEKKKKKKQIHHTQTTKPQTHRTHMTPVRQANKT